MRGGDFYIDMHGMDEFTDALRSTAGDIKDLTKLYRQIGKKAGLYVKTHEPRPMSSKKDSKTHLPHGYMQAMTKGGGGKGGAWVTIKDVPYLFVQEFGGSSFWSRSGAGSAQAAKRSLHIKTHAALVNAGAKGHVIYRKPRRRRGYFIWNVAYRLRSYIGATLTEGLADIGKRHGLATTVVDRNLDIEQDTWGGTS